jgi:arabinofuranosyltransferase
VRQQIGGWGGVTDERAFYAATNTLFDRSGRLRTHVGGHSWVDHGLRLRAGAEPPVLEHGAVGMLGFYAGPTARIVDPTGLTDPLLARLPVERRGKWRIGHLKRALPPGYLHARETGSLERMDADLAAFYEVLRRITSAPVFDAQRLRTLLAFHLGHHDAARPGRVPEHPR